MGALLLALLFIVSCKNTKNAKSHENEAKYEEVVEESYELHTPNSKKDGVLVLFGGFPQNAKGIKQEFKILDLAKKNNIAVLYMNYNRTLWMTSEKKNVLKQELETIFKTHKLPHKNVHIGGFSSGGNATLLLSDYLISTKSAVQPKGIFVVDSPVDLLELYRVSERNVARNLSEGSTQEAKWIIGMLNKEFGEPKDGIQKYETYSPYTAETQN